MKTINRSKLLDLALINSPRLPRTVDDGGRRMQWVGIGWVDEGPADGTEQARVITNEQQGETDEQL